MIRLPDSHAILESFERDGFAIVPGVLSPDDASAVRAALWRTVEALRARGTSTFTSIIDPNDSNVRVYDLPDHDPLFLALLADAAILELVRLALAGAFLASNFTANIARPGAEPMRTHSDQALVFPAPWLESWTLNVIWCLDDVHVANGATRYLPGSHRITTLADLPDDAEAQMRPFEAPAGAVILMDGRLWHSSGRNVTADRDRAMLFAYYSRSFIRTQVNWHEVLRPETIAGLDEDQRRLLGFGPLANMFGAPMVMLETAG